MQSLKLAGGVTGIAVVCILMMGCDLQHRGQPPTMPQSPGTYYKGGYAWGEGVTPAVPDGVIVLVKSDRTVGAFILKDQRTDGRNPLSYEYFYRTDGRGKFSGEGSDACVHGTKVIPAEYNAGPHFQVLVFGPFRVPWNANEDGKGWVFYPRKSGEKIAPSDLRICVTSETDISKIDATDRKWLYKGSPSDPGIRLSATRK